MQIRLTKTRVFLGIVLIGVAGGLVACANTSYKDMSFERFERVLERKYPVGSSVAEMEAELLAEGMTKSGPRLTRWIGVLDNCMNTKSSNMFGSNRVRSFCYAIDADGNIGRIEFHNGPFQGT